MTKGQQEARAILERAFDAKERVRVEFSDGTAREGKLDKFQVMQQAAVLAEHIPFQFRFQGDTNIHRSEEIAKASTV